MAPFEVCWVADGAAKAFGVPNLRGFRDYHLAYLQKELRCKGLGRCVNYNLVVRAVFACMPRTHTKLL